VVGCVGYNVVRVFEVVWDEENPARSSSGEDDGLGNQEFQLQFQLHHAFLLLDWYAKLKYI
jgi:hypothetical protein